MFRCNVQRLESIILWYYTLIVLYSLDYNIDTNHLVILYPEDVPRCNEMLANLFNYISSRKWILLRNQSKYLRLTYS